MQRRSAVAGLGALFLALAPAGAGAAPPPAHDGASQVSVHQPPLDELSQAVVAYPLTLERLTEYAAAVKALRAAAEQDPALRGRLLEKRPQQEPLAAAIKRLDAVKPLQPILASHGLGSRDFLLMPSVVLAGRAALMAEQAGRPGPADRVNASSLALHRAQPAKVEALTLAFRADLRALEGR